MGSFREPPNGGEIVDLEIPTPVIPAPYAETFGIFWDEPTFANFVEEVNQYRHHQNAGAWRTIFREE